MVRLSRLLRVGLVAVLLPTLCGCLTSTFVGSWVVKSTCTTAGTCTVVFQSHQPGTSAPKFNETTTADANGCFWLLYTSACQDASDDVQVCDPIYAGQSLAIALLCAWDPMIVEWPDSWNIRSAFWSGNRSPFGGLVISEPLSAYTLPPGFGPVVTDPGYSAHVVHLDADGFAYDSLKVTVIFTHPSPAGAYIKAVSAATAALSPSGPKLLLPLGAPGVDFTQIPTSDPYRALAVGDLSTLARPATWGRIKTIYR